jgi:hypothetical protein
MYQLERYQADLKRFSNAQQSPEIQGSTPLHTKTKYETNNAKIFTASSREPASA